MDTRAHSTTFLQIQLGKTSPADKPHAAAGQVLLRLNVGARAGGGEGFRRRHFGSTPVRAVSFWRQGQRDETDHGDPTLAESYANGPTPSATDKSRSRGEEKG